MFSCGDRNALEFRARPSAMRGSMKRRAPEVFALGLMVVLACASDRGRPSASQAGPPGGGLHPVQASIVADAGSAPPAELKRIDLAPGERRAGASLLGTDVI